MLIESTDIVYSEATSSVSGARLLLADQIIDIFTPLFSNEIDRQKRLLNGNIADVSKLKKDILENKQHLKSLNENIKKEIVKTEILNEVEYLYNYGILYGKNRQIVNNILLSMDDKSLSSLTGNLKILRRLVKSNINKIK
jgi:hypothetical protein